MGRIELEKQLNGAIRGAITVEVFPTRLLINRRNRMEFGVVTPFSVQIHLECAHVGCVCVCVTTYFRCSGAIITEYEKLLTHTQRGIARTPTNNRSSKTWTTRDHYSINTFYPLSARIPIFNTYVCVLYVCVCDTLCMCIGPVRNPYSRYFMLLVLQPLLLLLLRIRSLSSPSLPRAIYWAVCPNLHVRILLAIFLLLDSTSQSPQLFIVSSESCLWRCVYQLYVYGKRKRAIRVWFRKRIRWSMTA